MSELFQSKGILHYSQDNVGGFKLVVRVDQQISEYYRWFVPRYILLNRPMHPAHISVVRKEAPVFVEHWGKYEGEIIPFDYSNVVHFGTVYCWLNAFSYRLQEIRMELGLSNMNKYTMPPDGRKCFHITIGNFKESPK